MHHVYHITNKDSRNLLIGYIGETSRSLDDRWEEHTVADSKVGNKIRTLGLTRDSMYLIFSGTKRECLAVEQALRPKKRMGWNVAEGGPDNSYSKWKQSYLKDGSVVRTKGNWMVKTIVSYVKVDGKQRPRQKKSYQCYYRDKADKTFSKHTLAMEYVDKHTLV